MNDIFILDTNTLISAAILPNSVSGRAFFLAEDIGLLAVSKKTLAELESVIFRPKFNKYLPSASDKRLFIERVEKSSLLINPLETITACRDPKDDKFLELAVAAEASCIVTGDEDLLVLNPFRAIPILKAVDILVRF